MRDIPDGTKVKWYDIDNIEKFGRVIGGNEDRSVLHLEEDGNNIIVYHLAEHLVHVLPRPVDLITPEGGIIEGTFSPVRENPIDGPVLDRKAPHMIPIPIIPEEGDPKSLRHPRTFQMTPELEQFHDDLVKERDQQNALEDLCKQFLYLFGIDPTKDSNLTDTPRRWAKMWQEFLNYDDTKTDTTFESITVDQMVVVGPIRVWSMCAHHLSPFFTDVTIGYIPEDRVLGLSKFGRVAIRAGHKLQVQERLVEDIARDISKLTETEDVAVVGSGRHLCMETRGIKTPAIMTTSILKGCFRKQKSARAEFFELLKQNERRSR